MNMRMEILAVVTSTVLCCPALADGETLVDENGHILPGKTVDGVTRPDWANLTSFDIPWGKTYIAYDEDIAHINANLSKMDFGSNRTLILDGITSWPVGKGSPECLFWAASGDLIVRVNGSVTVKRYNYRVSGTLTLESGELVQENYYTWGGDKNAKIVVKDGATFRFNFSSSVLGNTRVYASGTGVGGKGAVVLDAWYGDGCVPYLELQGDTRVVINKNGGALSAYTKPGTAGSLGTLRPGTLKLNGHTLTIGGTATSLTFDDMQVQPDGETDAEKGKIVFEALAAGGARTILPVGLTQFDLPIEAGCGLKLTTGIWNGDFTMGEGTTLNLAPASAVTLTMAGSVSGEGGLSFGEPGAEAAGTVRLLAANGYTGATTVNGSSSFVLALGRKGAIPDYSKLTVNGGRVGASVLYDEGGAKTWTAQEVLELGSNLVQTTMAVDASALDDPAELVFSAADVAKYFPAADPVWDSVGASGGFTLTGPYDVSRPLVLNQTAGRIVLSGDEPITIGNSAIAGPAVTRPELVVSGATVYQGDELVQVGSAAGNGVLVVTNAQWLSTSTTKPTDNQAGLDCNAIYLGYKNGIGILEIQAGGLVSNKVIVGGGTYVNQGSGSGAIYVHPGAKFYAKVPGDAHLGSSIGQSVFGYLQQTGGEIAGPNLYVGGYDKGVFHMYGGEVNIDYFNPARCNSGKGIVYVTNGTITVENYLQPSHGMDTTTQITLGGPEAKLITKTTYLYSSNHGKAKTQINLNDGGLIRIGAPATYYTHAQYVEAGNPYHDLLSFNGGIFQARAGEDLFQYNADKHYARVTVAEKGAVIDTNGKDCSLNANIPIEGVVGGGIQAIDLGGAIEGLAGAPYVAISGDGYGATAVADWDPEARVLKGVIVTARGWGYVQGAVTVSLKSCGWSKTLSGAAITVGDNEIGGFTKRGEGTLTLKSDASTWAKWTRVEGGTLKTAVAGAIPDGTYLALSNGATLDLNNVSGDTVFAGVDGTGGTVANGTVKIVGEWKVSARKFLSRESTAVVGTVDLTDCTGITLVDTEVLDDEALRNQRGLTLFSATEAVGLGSVEISGAPEGWHLTKRANGFRLGPDIGSVLIVR